GVVDLRDHRRRVERTVAVRRLTADHHFRALLAAFLNEPMDPIAVIPRDERPHLRLGVERIADLDPPREVREATHKVLVQRLLDENARTGLAALPRRVVDRPDRARDRGVEVRGWGEG